MIQADIIQTIRCNVCKKQRIEDANNWYECWQNAEHYIFAPISLPVVKTKAYLCGKEHLFKFLNELLQ